MSETQSLHSTLDAHCVSLAYQRFDFAKSLVKNAKYEEALEILEELVRERPQNRAFAIMLKDVKNRIIIPLDIRKKVLIAEQDEICSRNRSLISIDKRAQRDLKKFLGEDLGFNTWKHKRLTIINPDCYEDF